MSGFVNIANERCFAPRALLVTEESLRDKSSLKLLAELAESRDFDRLSLAVPSVLVEVRMPLERLVKVFT